MTQTTKKNGWMETTLGEVVEIIDGDRGINYPNGDDFSSDGFCLFLNTKNVPDTQFSFSEKMFISKEKDELLRKGKLKQGDFILTTRGTVGNYAYYSRKIIFKNIRINSGMVILRTKEDQGFFYHYLGSPLFKNQILSLQSGTAQPQLPIRDLKTFEILLPPLPEQQAIASVLSAFDDKIELLREQNKTLEETAQAIFKEWFGKYGIEDELPGGWRVGKLGEVVDLLNGFAYKSSDFIENGKYRLVTIANVQDGSFVENTKDGLDEIPQKMPDYCNLKTGDILLSLTGNVGRICHVVGENYFLNQRVAKLQAKEKQDYGFIYTMFRQNSMIGLLESISAGTAQQNLSPIKTAELEIIIPSREILNGFANIINPMIDKMLDNKLQIQTLSKTRDSLLPKLMRGDLRVKNFN